MGCGREGWRHGRPSPAFAGRSPRRARSADLLTQLALGQTFAGYRIEALVGRGGMGVVYRATELALDRPVALKLVVPELSEDERFRARFLRESRLAASLEHPHVLPVHAAGEAEGALFLAMRFVEGKDLRSRLAREGRLEPAEALRIVSELASALDAAHARGLVHRDVKPGNVLLARSGESYLCDFGLTKRTSSQSGLTETGQLLGTLDYLAPEQIRAEPTDGRADLYSLACLLYECLTGEPPFRRESEAQLLWAHLSDQPPSLSERRPELPGAIDEVIRRALAKEPAERYPTCAAFAEAAWAAFGIGAEVRRTPLIPAGIRRRGKLLVLLGAPILGGAAAAAAVFATQGGETAAPVPAPAPEPAAVAVERNSVAVIDAKANEVVDDIPVGNFPTSIAVGEGAVWVLNADDRTVSRIDLQTRGVRTIATGATPTDLAVGEGALWVVNGFEGTVSRIDPGSTLVEKEITLPEPPPPRSDRLGSAIAVGRGAVWVSGSGLAASGAGRSNQPFLWRIDPGTNAVVASIPGVGGGPLAVGKDALWTSEISRIDPSTNSVVATISFPTVLADVTVGAGAVWAMGETLWRINQAQADVEETVALGGDGVAVGAGSVWVWNRLDGTVSRVDPKTNAVVKTISVGNSPNGVAVGGGLVWVTVG